MSKSKLKIKLGKRILTCPLVNKELKATFICSNLGKVTHVQIPINKFINFMNDHDDMISIINSRHEEYIPWEDFKKQLVKQHAKRGSDKKSKKRTPKIASQRS
ncbi:MAG: hypothetical protein HQM16_01225 [Deltaproteobacteria bacterium]|nr:hypothetical protein [Deltaproteobacteria bacterium]